LSTPSEAGADSGRPGANEAGGNNNDPPESTPPASGESNTPDERSLVRTAVNLALSDLDQSRVELGYKNDENYALLATFTQDPAIAEKIASPYHRAKTLAVIAKDTGDEALTAKATETAMGVQVASQQNRCLMEVSRELGSIEPLKKIADTRERDPHIRTVAVSLGDTSLIEHIQDPGIRNRCRVDIAVKTKDIDTISALTDTALKDDALSRVAADAADPSYLADVGSETLKNQALHSIIIKTGNLELADQITDSQLRYSAIHDAKINKNYKNEVKTVESMAEERKAAMMPLDKISQAESRIVQLTQYQHHLEFGNYGPETTRAIAERAADLTRRLGAENLTYNMLYLSELTGDKQYALEVLERALDIDNPDKGFEVISNTLATLYDIDHPGRRTRV
jgi:hypothetical protein